MNQPTHQQIATYLTNYALSELVKYVMEDVLHHRRSDGTGL